ncbi:exonuclease domain-containing protein (plasmid) [Methylomarinum sp. Ch1-1]|uniref:Exonuclease domain-containing protein n=1 Tax=Methylomarinum roseum TaxID=3067653 RepID=A0AAU7P0K9_9GAMM|nr:exonuclease domain-containing protein [Methylomarinum sp. Ch1-1]MDP4523282.1 exonuclease domain-containing protein [Methylomarinum sp. Ch1-1]
MSVDHWKSLLTPTRIKLPNITALAREQGRIISFIDLETTDFLGRPNFGICEIGCLHILRDGRVFSATSLVNPENLITPSSTEITGVTQAMVNDKSNWHALWAEACLNFSAKHLVSGFNSTIFDIPAIQDQNERYGLAPGNFDNKMDVMD